MAQQIHNIYSPVYLYMHEEDDLKMLAIYLSFQRQGAEFTQPACKVCFT